MKFIYIYDILNKYWFMIVFSVYLLINETFVAVLCNY